MKYKVGDKVRIKSKEWWDAQPKNNCGSVECGKDTFAESMTCMCGKIVQITRVVDETYGIEGHGLNWTDEMFEGLAEEPTLFDRIKSAIIKAGKQAPIIIEQTEDGGIKISPIEEKEEDLPIDTPCMCSDDKEGWFLRYYAFKGKVFVNGGKSKDESKTTKFNYTIPCDKFNFENPEESYKYIIEK